MKKSYYFDLNLIFLIFVTFFIKREKGGHLILVGFNFKEF